MLHAPHQPGTSYTLNPVHQPAQALRKPAWPQAARLMSLQSFNEQRRALRRLPGPGPLALSALVPLCHCGLLFVACVNLSTFTLSVQFHMTDKHAIDWVISLGTYQPGAANWTLTNTSLSGLYPHHTQASHAAGLPCTALSAACLQARPPALPAALPLLACLLACRSRTPRSCTAAGAAVTSTLMSQGCSTRSCAAPS